MKVETIEAMAAAGNRATGTGVGVMFMGFITSSGFLGLAGLMVGLGGLLVNWYYKRQSDRRAQHLFALQAGRLRNQTPLNVDECLMREDDQRGGL